MRDRGSATVEFALVLPVLLVVLLASVEVFAAARLQLQLGHAAREGARVAATAPDVDRAVAAVRRSLDGPLGAAARVSVDRQQHVGGVARVTVSSQHRLVSLLFGGVSVTLEASAAMRVER